MIIVLPSCVSGYTFAWYLVDYFYVGLSPIIAITS